MDCLYYGDAHSLQGCLQTAQQTQVTHKEKFAQRRNSNTRVVMAMLGRPSGFGCASVSKAWISISKSIVGLPEYFGVKPRRHTCSKQNNIEPEAALALEKGFFLSTSDAKREARYLWSWAV